MGKYFFILSLILASDGFAYLNPPQIISLMPSDNNLENENQIEQLCPKTLKDSQVCRKEKLAPRIWKLNIYEKPDFSSKRLGEIRVIGTPGKGMQAQYVPLEKSPIDFPSDSNGTDWGYSCYFEFTVSDVKGDWIQLPKRPFSYPIWINIKKDWPKKSESDLIPTSQSLDTESVYSVKKLGNIVIKKFSGTNFTYRMENANDMNCGDESKKISPEELKESTKPISNLFDEDGHLIAWPAYCRGC